MGYHGEVMMLNQKNDDRDTVEGSCAHDRIRHETKNHSSCVNCGVRMVRDRGDWKPSTAGTAVGKEA